MTASIVIFTEEPSARIVIEQVSKRIVSSSVQVLQHAGKSDLEQSITRKINGWRSPYPTHFIITRDLDRGTRQSVKNRLLSLVPTHSQARTKIRVVVPELEAWYLGDPQALMAAGLINENTARKITVSAKFRNLCNLQNAKSEFKKIVGNVGQIAAAELIAPVMNLERNRSVNFQAFVKALQWAEVAISAM